MRDLEKTRKLLNERRKQNREAGYGRPIPDITWNEVSKEIADCERKLANYRTLSIGLVLIIIFISSYLLL
jgi:hypothetical protein